MKIVFDTNVVIAGIVAEGLCRELVELHLPAHEPVLSEPLWDELVATLERKFGLDADELPILGLYRRLADWVEIEALAEPVCRDRDDDRVLATAKAGGATLVVTGDDDLLCLERWSEIEIVSPRGFLERLLGGA